MAKKQKKAKAKPKANKKAKSAAKKAVKKPQAKLQKKIQAVKAPVKAAAPKPEKVLAGKKQAFSVKPEEKKKTPKPFVLDEDFEEKMGEDIFEKKGLAGGKDEEAESKKAKEEDDDDDDDEWDDDDESEVGEGNKKSDWQTPLPGRFEGEDQEDL